MASETDEATAPSDHIKMYDDLDAFKAAQMVKVEAGTLSKEEYELRVQKLKDNIEARILASTRTFQGKAKKAKFGDVKGEPRAVQQSWGNFGTTTTLVYKNMEEARYAIGLSKAYGEDVSLTERSKKLGAGVVQRGVLHWEFDGGQALKVMKIPGDEDGRFGIYKVSRRTLYQGRIRMYQ